MADTYYAENGYDNTQLTLYERMGKGSTLHDFFRDGEIVIT